MDINQIIDLWRGLSPHLARAIPDQELPEGGHTDEKKSDGDSEDETVNPTESHHEGNDV